MAADERIRLEDEHALTGGARPQPVRAEELVVGQDGQVVDLQRDELHVHELIRRKGTADVLHIVGAMKDLQLPLGRTPVEEEHDVADDVLEARVAARLDE